MYKKLTFIALGASVATYAMAAPISPDEALARMNAEGPAKVRAMQSSKMSLVHTAKTKAGINAAYVFATPGHTGFTVLSADDIAIPVLGYSDSDNFDANNIPTDFKWWMDEYARQIEFAVSNGVKAGKDEIYAPADWAAISPMVKTKWDQMAPYNNDAPEQNGKKCAAGCVATSFAQAMNYFKYPEVGTGVVSYRWGTKNMRLNFSMQPFDWDNMLDTYTAGSYNDEQAAAVAYLMKACGYSVQMDYGESSGATSVDLIYAMTTYFKYDEGVRYLTRDYYSTQEWTGIIYDNLKNIGPVIYNGTSLDGGHSFICDGYDGNGYFHINWGWSGMSDGYFSLSALNPDAQGTGGGVGGFNYSQDAVIGMQKPTGKPATPEYGRVIQYGSATGSVDGNVLSFGVQDYYYLGWGNSLRDDVSMYIGAEFQSMKDPDASPIIVEGEFANGYGKIITLGQSQYWSQERTHPEFVIPSNLPNGDYKVTLMSKDTLYEDAPWQSALTIYGFANYCWLTVEDGVYTVRTEGLKKIEFKDVTLGSPLYPGKNAKLQALLKNDSDLELTTCIQPQLTLNDEVQYIGEYMLVSLDPNSEETFSWPVKFYATSGTTAGAGTAFRLRLVNRVDNSVIGDYGYYTLEKSPGITSVKVDEFKIDGCSQQDVKCGSKDFKNVFVVGDTRDLDVICKYHVTRGYFDYNFRLVMNWYNPDTNTTSTYIDDVYSNYPFLSVDESSEADVKVDMSDAPNGGVYSIAAGYYASTRMTTLSTIYFTFDATGVEGVIADEDSEPVEYYNLQGAKITTPAPGEVVIVKKGAKTYKTIAH